MRLILLDRDGVVVVNRKDNIRTPADLALIPGAPEAIARLNTAGFRVALCTNQPEVGRGVMTQQQLDTVHDGLRRMIAEKGAVIDLVVCCSSERKSPRRKPAAGMLTEAMTHFGALAVDTPFIGDQLDDLRAAFHAGCRRMLVRTGLGRKTLAAGLPQYLEPVSVHDDLAAAVTFELGSPS